MPSLLHLYNKTIIIARFAISSGDKMEFTTVTSALGQIQPIDDSKDEVSSGLFGKTFNLYMDGVTDIQEGDELRDNDTGEKYRVETGGVSRRTFGSIDFLLVIINKMT